MAIMIKVERPNGATEWINASEKMGLHGMTKPLFAEIKHQTRQNGGGKVLTWERRRETPEWMLALLDVERAEDEAERARDYPARYLELAEEAEAARREWEQKYPAEAEAHYQREREAAAARRAPAADPYTN